MSKMRKLLLTSSGLSNRKIANEFINLVGKTVEEITILFVPTASRSKDELFYVGKTRQQFLDLGIPEKNIIDFVADNPIHTRQIFDIIVVCGGNSFYLLSKLKQTKYFDFFAKKVNEGTTYVGISAGSVIATPNIKYINGMDINDCGLKDFDAFGWIDGALVPHYSDDDSGIKEYVENLKEQNKPLYVLTDEQAIKIIDNEKQIVGNKKTMSAYRSNITRHA